jgi:hypothetical protein
MLIVMGRLTLYDNRSFRVSRITHEPSPKG